MVRPLLTVALALSLGANAFAAEPRRHSGLRRVSLASMNLTPRSNLNRPIDRRDFSADATPTTYHYALPARGMGAVVGYRSSADYNPIPAYEVNQATALGFKQPASSVGAGLDFTF